MKYTYGFTTIALLALLPWAAFADHHGHGGSFERCMRAALDFQPGDIIKVEFKHEEGRGVYEFEIAGEGGIDYELECDARHGGIVEHELEVDSPDHALFKAKRQVSEAEAKRTATAIYPGKVIEVEYEIEADGSASYEIDIDMTSGREMKIEVDASSGEIVEANRELWQVGRE
jgi:uncharacterized membrane protein YkoI